MISGSCLCGAVRFQIDGQYSPIGQCHCYKCRKVTGAAAEAAMFTAATNLRWVEGQDQIVKYVMPDGHWKSDFCGTCGSPMPHLSGDGELYWVPAGLLDDDPEVEVTVHIYVDGKASWETIGGDAPQYPGDLPATQRQAILAQLKQIAQ